MSYRKCLSESRITTTTSISSSSMENMVHATPSHTTVPSCFVFPPEHLKPATSSAAAAVSLPIIDLSRGRDEVCRAILDAGKEFGFFQVINHGISEQVMRDMEAVGEEFFGLPAMDKAEFYSESEDMNKVVSTRLFSSTTYETGGEKYWRDCLRLVCSLPVNDDSTKDWPHKPPRLREVTENFITLTRGLGMELLRLLCEAMGLQLDYFKGDICGDHATVDINHYPPCPDPSTTLGLPPHCDRNLLTLLLPSMVPGLEVAYNGDWIKVQPLPDAFVVNFGSQLEVVTNGLLRSIEHRVTTNSARARTSVVTYIVPTLDCLIGPAEEFLSEDNPPCYRTLTYRDFKRIYNVVRLGESLNLTTNLKDVQTKEV